MLRVFFFVLLFPFAALAQGLPDPISDRINDFADLLPPEAEARVAQTLQQAREETGVHIVLVTMERMAQNGGVGEPISEYAKRLFNQWGIGDASRNDGILILVARTDREMRIALGSAYPVIWDNAAQRVIDRHMLPEFREDRYAEGIEAGVVATVDLIARPFTAGAEAPSEDLEPEDWGAIGTILLFMAGAGLIAARDRIGNILTSLKPCPNCGQRALSRSKEILQQATRDMAGQGRTRIHCSACGKDRFETYTIPRDRENRSSDSGGFGGGSSSGGGASGRW